MNNRWLEYSHTVKDSEVFSADEKNGKTERTGNGQAVSYDAPPAVILAESEDEMKDQALIKKKRGIRKGAHVWTDEERKKLVRERAAGRSWDDLAEEYGVSKAAVQIQVTRGRKEKK